MNTLQEQYNLITEGKGNKAQFLKSAKFQFPNLFNAFTSYEDAANVLKSKGLISEGIGGVVTGGVEQDWVKIFKDNITEEVKAEEKKTSKEVEDVLTHNFDYKDDKNIDNVYGQSFLHGFYTEMQDPKNEDKTVDQVKEIVRKNLAKDRLYYTKDGMFGIKGLGYTEEAPGLGPTKEVAGKYKSSGMEPVKLREGLGMSQDQDMLQAKNIALNVVDELPSNYTDEDLANEIDKYLTQAAVSPEVYDRDIEPNFREWMAAIKTELTNLAVANNPGASEVGNMLRASTARSTQMEELKATIHEIIQQELNEAKKKPSTGLTKKEKSTISKKAHAGKDIGKKGKGFEKVAKAAEKQYGSKEAGEKVAAAAMWKSQAKKKMSESQALKEEIFNLFKKKGNSGEINVKDNPLLTPQRAERLADILLIRIADDNTPQADKKYYVRQYERLRNQMPELNLHDPAQDVDESTTDLYTAKTNTPGLPLIVDPDETTEKNPKFQTLYRKIS